MILLPLFGIDKSDITLVDGKSSLEGLQISWDPGYELKAITLYGVPAGTSTFSVYFRYFNGRILTEYELIELNDSAGTTVFGSATAYAGKILGMPIHLQRWRLQGMLGGQLKITRESGSGDIAFTKGFASVDQIY